QSTGILLFFGSSISMRSLPRLLLLACLSALPVLAQAQLAPPAPTLAAKAWLLIDNGSGQVLATQDPDTRIEPASLTKLMTAYLSFSAIKQGVIKRDQQVNVSENAWKVD